MKNNYSIRKTVNELAKREIRNCGRWCEVTLKRTGETILISRTGYGPMECPENDSHEIFIGEEVVAKFDDLYGVAEWFCERG